MKIIILVAILALTAVSGYGQILSVNFNADTDRMGAALASTDTAGVVPVANWNNVAYTDGTIAGGLQTWTAANLNDSTGVASGVSLTANTTNLNAGPDGLWGQGGAIAGDGSSELFSGGLQIRDQTVTLNLTNLSTFAPNGYDLYVYFSAGNGVSTTVSTDSTSTTLLPSGYSGTYVDGTGGNSGNYVLFTGLTEDQLNLNIAQTVGYTYPGTNVAGIEIVAAVPEPSSYVLLGVGLVALMFVARRKSALNRV